MCLFVYVTYSFKEYVMCTLLGMWDAYAYYYSYTPLMSCLHLDSYKLPTSCPVAVKLRFHVMWCGHSTVQDKLYPIRIELQENMERVVD